MIKQLSIFMFLCNLYGCNKHAETSVDIHLLSIIDLSKHINDNPPPSHDDVTPAVEVLISRKTDVIPVIIQLMLSDDISERLRAQRVLEGVTMEYYGFKFNHGWDMRSSEEKWRAFWKDLGGLDYRSSHDDRKRAVSLWVDWYNNKFLSHSH